MLKKAIIFLLHIPLTALVLFEYFAFMWFWSGDGSFAFFGCGISFIIYLTLHIFAWHKASDKFRKLVLYSAVILTPILSVVTVYLVLAPLFGVQIQIA